MKAAFSVIKRFTPRLPIAARFEIRCRLWAKPPPFSKVFRGNVATIEGPGEIQRAETPALILIPCRLSQCARFIVERPKLRLALRSRRPADSGRENLP